MLFLYRMFFYTLRGIDRGISTQYHILIYADVELRRMHIACVYGESVSCIDAVNVSQSRCALLFLPVPMQQSIKGSVHGIGVHTFGRRKRSFC